MARIYNLTKKKSLLILGIVTLVIAGVMFVLEQKQITSFIGEDSSSQGAKSDAKTTSTTRTADENFSDGEYRQPGNTLTESEGTGGISDTNGSVASVDKSNPTVSKTGEITIYSPGNNASVKSSITVAGSSTLPKVGYRIIDSVSGMIATGELNVINGQFSGTLSVSTMAKQGRLDIYGTRSDGAEFSNVEIPLRFE